MFLPRLCRILQNKIRAFHVRIRVLKSDKMWPKNSKILAYARIFLRCQCAREICGCTTVKKWKIFGCFVSALEYERNLTWWKNGRFLTMNKKMVKYDLIIEKLKTELDCVRNLIEFKNWKNQGCASKNQDCVRRYMMVLLLWVLAKQQKDDSWKKNIKLIFINLN